MIVILGILGLGLAWVREYYFASSPSRAEIVIESYRDLPELRLAIVLMVALNILIVLMFWWWRHHEDGGVWKTKT